jgi:hypothetical protein
MLSAASCSLRKTPERHDFARKRRPTQHGDALGLIVVVDRWSHSGNVQSVDPPILSPLGFLKLVIALISQYTAMELVDQVPSSWASRGKWGRL